MGQPQLMTWQHRLASPGEFRACIDNDLRPWRSTIGSRQLWSLSVDADRLLVASNGSGPDLERWEPVPDWRPPSVLPLVTPLEPLLQTLAADLVLTIAHEPSLRWGTALATVQHWPHRRRWRSRGAGPLMRSVRVSEPPPPSPIIGATEAAWTVLEIASGALPEIVRVPPTVAWGSLAQHVRRQFAAVEPSLLDARRASDRTA